MKKPDFAAALKGHEQREGINRRPQPDPEPPPSPSRQRSRIGKVSLGVWVDPAVRRQVAQIALDQDRDQGEVIADALNLLFEKHGKPQIA